MTPQTWRSLSPQPLRILLRRLALAGLCVLLLLPLLLVDVPPLLDYPNHLARAVIIAHGAEDPVLSRIYAVHWAVIPNLAIDLLLPPLLRVMPVHVAGRLVLAVCLVLPVWAALRYSYATFRSRSVWAAFICVTACNGLFLLGFVSFQLGVGLALLLAADWVRWRETRPRAAILLATLGAVALFFAHLMGLVFFLLLIGGYEVEQIWMASRAAGLARAGSAWRDVALRRGLALLPVVLPSAVLLSVSPFGEEDGRLEWDGLDEKAAHAASAVLNYSRPLDLASAALIMLFLAACADRGWLAVPVRTRVTLVALVLLFLLAPFGINGTGFLDSRLALMAAWLLFAGMLPARMPRRVGVFAGGLFGLLFGIRTITVAGVWAGHADDLAEFRTIARAIPEGARVLTVMVDDDEAAPGADHELDRSRLSDGTRLDGHVAALLVIERRAFWPGLFANPSQQPITLREPYLSLARRTAGIPNLRLLTEPGGGPPDAAFPIMGQWACCYDYVMQIPARAHPGFELPALEPLARGDFVTLFQVRRSHALSQAFPPPAWN